MTGRARQAAALAVLGAVLGALLGVLVHVLAASDLPDSGTSYHGRYVPLGDTVGGQAYNSDLSVTVYERGPDWVPLLPLSVGGGVALGLVAAGALALTKRRIALVSASSPT